MQPIVDTRRQQVHDLAGSDTAMSLDESAIEHLMSVLTKLYSDPAMAVIREYSTNALDANREAGNDDPINVTSPTRMNPTFVVEDKGVGLSPDEIANIYSKYGASTKRDSNEVVGMLGLGCKSALAYTDQFTMVAVKGGVRTVVQVSMTASNVGNVKIIDTSATDAPNGVTIKVPVSDVYDFQRKIRGFFRFWTPGTVLVDGEQPNHIEGTKVIDGVRLVREGLSNNYVVMGNVPYPVDDTKVNLSNKLGWRNNVIVEVPIGKVAFAPSRESLEYTPATLKTLRDIRDKIVAHVHQAAVDDVADADTYTEAIIRYQEWKDTVDGVTYKGERIPETFDFDEQVWRWFRKRKYGRTKSEQVARAPADHAAEALWVTGFTNVTFSTLNRNKIDAYCDQHDLDPEYVYVTDTMQGDKWLAGVDAADWDTINQIKLSSGTTSSGRKIAGHYNVYDSNRLFVKTAADKISQTKQIIYWSPSVSVYELSPSRVEEIFPDAVLMHVGKNRWDKLERDFPNAVYLGTALEYLWDHGVEQLSDAGKLALTNYNYYSRRVIQALYDIDADDPDVATAVALYKSARKFDKSDFNKVRSAYGYLVEEGYADRETLDTPDKYGTIVDTVIERYPLLDTSHSPGDITEYVNALYHYRKESK